MHSFSKEKNQPEVNRTNDDNKIKQFHIVEYFGGYIYVNLSEEFMEMKSLKKINTKLQF